MRDITVTKDDEATAVVDGQSTAGHRRITG
jgi:hypothetical protein